MHQPGLSLGHDRIGDICDDFDKHTCMLEPNENSSARRHWLNVPDRRVLSGRFGETKQAALHRRRRDWNGAVRRPVHVAR